MTITHTLAVHNLANRVYQFICLYIHSSIRLPVPLFVRSFIRLFFPPFVLSFVSVVLSFVRSFVRLFFLSFVRSFVRLFFLSFSFRSFVQFVRSFVRSVRSFILYFTRLHLSFYHSYSTLYLPTILYTILRNAFPAQNFLSLQSFLSVPMQSLQRAGPCLS